SLLFHPDPGRAEGCDLQPVTGEPPITLSYATSTVPRGCVSNSSLGTGHEVHVLSVEWSKRQLLHQLMLSLHWTSQEPLFPWGGGLVPVQEQGRATGTRWGLLLLALQDARLSLGTTVTPGPELPAATGEGQLLAWAQGAYGGVTSYSELRDPRWVQVRLGEDTGSPPKCVPQERFNAMPHLETEVFFHGVKGCSRGDAQSTRAAHIVRLQPEHSFPIAEVNLSLSCPERTVSDQILILQSRANLTWSLSVNNCHIQFLVSGNYKIVHISSPLIPGKHLPDTEQGLIAKAFEKNYSVIASYSTIPASARVSLEIQEHEAVRRVPTTTNPPPPPPNMLPHMLLLTLQPWKCTDETMEIVIARSHLEPIKDVVNITLRDISCQAEKNATHFMLKTPLSHCGTSLEGRGHANNEPPPSLAKGAVLRSVRVAFECNIPRELFLRLFPTAAFEAPQTELEVNKEAFVQVPPPAPPPAWGTPSPPGGKGGDRGPPPPHPNLHLCPPPSPQPPPLQNNTIFEKVLEVTVKDSWRLPNNRGLGLAAAPPITFGAFLIGALLTAGLPPPYSHTRPISKLQPVSPPAPASESSSTNHSIGSTPPPPCSTSSMA
ncbi:EGLN protein, partial [Phaetusa simplex]|nr:EGLN protein [Phaetusa simplex]